MIDEKNHHITMIDKKDISERSLIGNSSAFADDSSSVFAGSGNVGNGNKFFAENGNGNFMSSFYCCAVNLVEGFLRVHRFYNVFCVHHFTLHARI